MKILEGKSYGSIGHLPNSRQGPGDKGVNEGQARIACLRPRDKHDVVIVQEKLDGSNVGVVNHNGRILAVGRAGYLAASSTYLQHRYFALWVAENEDRFRALLDDGERVCGEWLAQAHGTRYALRHEPFIAFDIMRGTARVPYEQFAARVQAEGFVVPKLLSLGPPLSIEAALKQLGQFGHHGALDPAEGVVWRVERKGKVDFLAKYVRPDKVDGLYFPELTGGELVWNWKPATAGAQDVQT